MIKYFTIEDLLKHYLQKKFHILHRRPSKTLFTEKVSHSQAQPINPSSLWSW